jgi:hypothetical protein
MKAHIFRKNESLDLLDEVDWLLPMINELTLESWDDFASLKLFFLPLLELVNDEILMLACVLCFFRGLLFRGSLGFQVSRLSL